MIPKNPSFLSMLGPIFTQKFIIMVIVILACIFCYRSFCRFLCPLGAIYGIFNKLSVIGVKVDANRCNNCGACVRFCKMDVKTVGDHECIHCAQCVARCNQGALSMKAGGFTLIQPHKQEFVNTEEENKVKKAAPVIGIIAVLVLAFAIIWTNFLDPSLKASADAADTNAQVSENTSTETPETESIAPEGYEIGQHLKTFETKCIDGSTFNLSDTKGKVVFINLWATYCGPCVKELPHFNELYHKHEGDIAMLAVHANLTTEDVNAYIAEKGWDIPFAIDDDAETIFKIVNGSSALPQTIVLDKKGNVIYNQVGSVTPEALEMLYEKASSAE